MGAALARIFFSQAWVVKAFVVAVCGLALQFRFDIPVWLVLFPAVMAGAGLYGRWEERAVAAALAIDLVVSYLVGFYDTGSSRLGELVTDGAFLLVLAVIAVVGRRWWPGWATAFQLMIVVIHALFVVRGEEIGARPYLVALVIWTWLVMLSLASGVWDRIAEAQRNSAMARRKGAIGAAAVIYLTALGLCLWQLAETRGAG